MTEYLDEIVTNKKLAWDNTLIDEKQKFFVKLNSEIIQELIEKLLRNGKLN